MKRPKPIHNISNLVKKHRYGSIKDVVSEATAGGIVYRRTPENKVQVLLVQDAKNRWTIPKGHIEPGEEPKFTAEREVMEETGLKTVKAFSWLGKIEFRYRRETSLVLMITHIFLIEAQKPDEELVKEEWMSGIKWFDALEAYDIIEYEDIGKLILVALKKLRKLDKKRRS